MFLNGEYYWFSSETGRKYRGRNTGNVQVRGSHRFIIQWNRVSGSVRNMDRSICFIDERTYETRKNRKEHLGKNYMRKKIYKLSRNRIILGNKRNFNYLKEMM